MVLTVQVSPYPATGGWRPRLVLMALQTRCTHSPLLCLCNWLYCDKIRIRIMQWNSLFWHHFCCRAMSSRHCKGKLPFPETCVAADNLEQRSVCCHHTSIMCGGNIWGQVPGSEIGLKHSLQLPSSHVDQLWQQPIYA